MIFFLNLALVLMWTMRTFSELNVVLKIDYWLKFELKNNEFMFYLGP